MASQVRPGPAQPASSRGPQQSALLIRRRPAYSIRARGQEPHQRPDVWLQSPPVIQNEESAWHRGRPCMDGLSPTRVGTVPPMRRTVFDPLEPTKDPRWYVVRNMHRTVIDARRCRPAPTLNAPWSPRCWSTSTLAGSLPNSAHAPAASSAPRMVSGEWAVTPGEPGPLSREALYSRRP